MTKAHFLYKCLPVSRVYNYVLRTIRNPLLNMQDMLCYETLYQLVQYLPRRHKVIGGGADKSLARPGRKQDTATKLGVYSTYSPRSSINFLARCSTFCKPLKEKNSECCPSNQVPAAAMTSASEEKWPPFIVFFSPGNRW